MLMKFLGMVAVDSGKIMILDPCYAKYWSDDARDILESSEGSNFSKKHPELNYEIACKEQQLHFANGAIAAVTSRTNYGDGVYPVTAEIDEKGRPICVTIHFLVSKDEVIEHIKSQEIVEG